MILGKIIFVRVSVYGNVFLGKSLSFCDLGILQFEANFQQLVLHKLRITSLKIFSAQLKLSLSFDISRHVEIRKPVQGRLFKNGLT